jgi:hypothetical protein
MTCLAWRLSFIGWTLGHGEDAQRTKINKGIR